MAKKHSSQEEYTIGVDLGTSGTKVSLLRLRGGAIVESFTSPDDGTEVPIISPNPGWAEQDPNWWWENTAAAIRGVLEKAKIKAEQVIGIGIAYQMHGMTPVNSRGKAISNAIIWCDGRTAEIKQRVEKDEGLARKILSDTLNLPGHFTASKAKWFLDTYSKTTREFPREEHFDKMLLPGHYILSRATGKMTVTASGLSEGVLWSFREMGLSDLVMKSLRLDRNLIPEIKPTFGEHGRLTREAAQELGLKEGTPFTYFAGDQPNNAFSLRVLEPGEIAATAGTSAVVYGVTNKITYDERTRVNSFLHVNSTTKKGDNKNLRIGILGCINGAGISYRWARDNFGGGNYETMNDLAESVLDTNRLAWIPFGNGPERTQMDRNTGAHLVGLDLNRHTKAHVFRAIQEGVVYAMMEAVNVMKDMGLNVKNVRAGYANMFKSRLFRITFANTIGSPLELYDTDGAAGAARGAAVGSGMSIEDSFKGLKLLKRLEPATSYGQWREQVERMSRR